MASVRPIYLEEPCRTAINPVRGMMFEWSLNPYMGCAHRCTFCYVRAFEHRADRPWDDQYGTVVRVKTNIAQVLACELERPSWEHGEVVIGAATDPYQPAEGRYRLTRACIRVLTAHRTPFSIITRGPLIVRDIDLLSEAARKVEVGVSFSIPTLDPDVWRTTEPSTAPPEQRLRALRRLREAGIDAGVAMAPILPGLSDSPEGMAAVVRAARAAGATAIWTELLHLRPGTREHYLAHLARDWPEQLERYTKLYAGRAYLPDARRAAIKSQLADIKKRIPASGPALPVLAPPAEPEQLDLAI